MLRDIIAAALRKVKFFRVCAEILTQVPEYDPTEQRDLTPEEQAWLDEFVRDNA